MENESTTPPVPSALADIYKRLQVAVQAQEFDSSLFQAVMDLLLLYWRENFHLAEKLKSLQDKQKGKTATRDEAAAQLQLMIDAAIAQAHDESVDAAQAVADAQADAVVINAEAVTKEKEKEKRKTRKGNGGREKPKDDSGADLPTRFPHLDIVTEIAAVTPPHADATIIGYVDSWLLAYKPGTPYLRHLRTPTFKMPVAEGSRIVQPAAPARLVKGIRADVSLLAWLLVAKYLDCQPLHRLHRALIRDCGIEIPVSTLANWMMLAAEPLERLAALMLTDIDRAFIAGVDATGLRYQSLDGRGAPKGCIWTYLIYDDRADRPPNTVFRFAENGEADSPAGPWTILAKRQTGFLQADASNAFDRIVNGTISACTEVGCHAHAYRRFLVYRDNDPRVAEICLLYRQIFLLEQIATIDGLTPTQRQAFRLQRTAPVLQKLHKAIIRALARCTPGDTLAKDCQYCVNHWEALNTFLQDGRIRPDNNYVERNQRVVRLGENNYLFAGSPAAGKATASILSVLVTAREHCGPHLSEYLNDLLTRLCTSISNDSLRSDWFPARWMARKYPGYWPETEPGLQDPASDRPSSETGDASTDSGQAVGQSDVEA